MENLILVDIFNNKIGELEKMQAHIKPILHRAFSLFIYHNNKILLQKRANNKYHSGGKWANSCCSHPRTNLSFEQSVINRVKEELGIDISSFTKIDEFVYMTKFHDNLFEYEYDNVLVLDEYFESIPFNKEEISEIKWMDIKELKDDLVDNPAKYASWFLICAPKVIKYIEEKTSLG